MNERETNLQRQLNDLDARLAPREAIIRQRARHLTKMVEALDYEVKETIEHKFGEHKELLIFGGAPVELEAMIYADWFLIQDADSIECGCKSLLTATAFVYAYFTGKYSRFWI